MAYHASLHHQSLNSPHYPHKPLPADSCCGPSCAGCCAKPLYCLEPNCCSPVGACPCFCTGSTATSSLALVASWLALPLLVSAMVLPDLFVYERRAGGTS